MKVALVHDWLIHMRGGEKVLDAIAELYPNATIHTLFYDKKHITDNLKNRQIQGSFLHRLPGIKKYYRWLLPIMPWALNSLDVGDADLVISSSHCVAKGIQTKPGAVHLCYCHTPMRYLYGFEDIYFKKYSAPVRKIINLLLNRIRKWDLSSNDGIHQFIANSENVKKRIESIYKRDANVIHPPVDYNFFQASKPKGDYYLTMSHFVPYKRIDLVIEAFNSLDKKLIVIGKGPMEKKYKKLRRSPKISFFSSVGDKELRDLYSEARAVIFPANEDFGIIPVEAQACGTPVVAYGKGGSLESVKSGVFFEEQSADAIQRAILKFENEEGKFEQVREKVVGFSRDQFKSKIQDAINDALAEKVSS